MKEIVKNDYYEISVDKFKNRAFLKLKGTWKTRSEVASLPKDIRSAANSLSKGFTILVNLLEMEHPKPEAAEVLAEAQTVFIQAEVGKAAEVVSSNILKMATGRIATETGMKKMQFGSVQEAEKWLDS